MGLLEVTQKIGAACERANRSEGDVELIAVSKVQPIERVQAVLEAGHRVFGENRVQEAAGKWPELRESFENVELHLIGPLQSNKVRQAMDLFDVIQTVDRIKLARTIARIRDEVSACPMLYVQVNTGEEPQKAGVLPADVDSFVSAAREMDLPIAGLMCLPQLVVAFEISDTRQSRSSHCRRQ